MRIEELLANYNFKETEAEMLSRFKSGRLHPTYERHLPVTWVIQSIWGHVEAEGLSLGKARELTAAAIEHHLKSLENASR